MIIRLGRILNTAIIAGAFFVLGHIFGGQLLNAPEIKLHGEVNPYMSERLREWVQELPDDAIADIHLETYGGHLSSGFKIAHYLKTTKARVTCTVDSHAMSAGSLILQSCPVIRVTPTATILYHLPRQRDPSSLNGYTVLPESHPLVVMFMDEVDRVGLLTKDERARVIKGEDVYITGSDFMDRVDILNSKLIEE